MPLEFGYIQGRPMMTAKLQEGKNRARYFEFLIDTGADYTLISKSDAQLLGIDYLKLETQEITVEVANLSVIHAKRAQVKMTLDNEEFTVPVLIAKENVERLLGRKGIFDAFDVLFQEKLGRVTFRRA